MKRTVTFDFGENRHVKLRVFSCKNEAFEIKTAKYELRRNDTQEIESEGNAEIIEHIMDVVISPKYSGFYDLKYIYSIADEILIDIVEIFVKEN